MVGDCFVKPPELRLVNFGALDFGFTHKASNLMIFFGTLILPQRDMPINVDNPHIINNKLPNLPRGPQRECQSKSSLPSSSFS